MNTTLSAALDYAVRGWRVHPLAGKKALLTGWPTVATTDPDTITGWWGQHPGANVGIAAYSDPSRPLIPTQVGHPFRRNAATESEVNPATFPSPLGIGGRHPSE